MRIRYGTVFLAAVVLPVAVAQAAVDPAAGSCGRAGAVLAVPTVSREGGGAQSPRAAVPTPEMLPSARVSAEHPLQSRGTRHGAPSGQGACHSRGSVEARAPSAASACVSSLGSAAQQPAGADF
jgi:hypothetical protein